MPINAEISASQLQGKNTQSVCIIACVQFQCLWSLLLLFV